MNIFKKTAAFILSTVLIGSTAAGFLWQSPACDMTVNAKCENIVDNCADIHGERRNLTFYMSEKAYDRKNNFSLCNFGYYSGTGGSPVKAADNLSFDKTTLSLGLGESYTLKPNFMVVEWASENSDYVKVENGKLTAKKIGTIRVGAVASGGGSAECRINVKKAPSKVSLTKTTLTLGVGESYKLSAVLPSGTAAAVRTFRTSNSKIVKMTKTNWEGQFTAVSTGTAWVTVRLYNGKEASCKITVKKAPDKVKLSKTNIRMKVGETSSLSAIIPDGTGSAERTFSSSNNNIVAMTKTNWTGQFKAVKKGTAWVTVRLYNGTQNKCKVEVV